MNKIFLFVLSSILLFLACGTSVQNEKTKRQKAVDEDEVIGRYSAQLVADPKSQDEIDQNIILNFLIDSLFDFQRTPSGIYYQIEKTGEGAHPTPQSTVTTHYRGTLMDGKEFDSSYRKGTPLMISMNRVIPGWQEALQILKPGGKGTFIIPSRLAYGQAGFPGLIQPNTVLIFEVELINFR
jgi:FKBP-type peptidyl-prolyl cis-trans isomerase